MRVGSVWQHVKDPLFLEWIAAIRLLEGGDAVGVGRHIRDRAAGHLEWRLSREMGFKWHA